MERRPNVLLIITEQHRGDCLGIEDHPVLLTPSMDGIAGEGARCTRAYTTCPTCIAARRSILSGQFPATHGMVGYRDGVEWDAPPTLPGVLGEADYQTVLIGRSMHQHPPTKRYGYDCILPHEGAYEEWLSERVPHVQAPFFSTGAMHNDWTAHPWPFPEHWHMTNWAVNEALHFLAQRDPSCPFFLTLSFHAAHPPLTPPPFYLERYLRTGVPDPVIGDWAEPPAHGGKGCGPASMSVDLRGEALLCARAAYYGLINHVDDQLRRVLDRIRRQEGDTVVVFTSDHGEMLGDHYCWHKVRPYEAAARIPLLVCAPRRFGIEPQTRIDAVACLEDIMPTVLEMAQVDVPDTVEGRSLLPLLRGEQVEWRSHLHIEHSPLHQSLTDGREKYIWFVQDGREQLFDLTADPTECHDLAPAPESAERLARWRRLLVEELKDRPEGFSDGERLVPGRPYPPVMPHAQPAGAP
jgi:arylsulfatase A-like enzyme